MLMSLLAACAPPPVVNCVCAPVPTEKALLEGAFIHTIEAIEVTGGSYRAPPSLGPTPTELRFDENLLSGTLGDGLFAVRVYDHVDVRHAEAPATGCCAGIWGDLEPADPQPDAWQDRNAAVMDWIEFGGVFQRLDPGATIESILPLFDEDFPVFAADADHQGFVLHTWYDVRPAGCTDATCASTVRVQHHFRRPS